MLLRTIKKGQSISVDGWELNVIYCSKDSATVSYRGDVFQLHVSKWEAIAPETLVSISKDRAHHAGEVRLVFDAPQHIRIHAHREDT